MVHILICDDSGKQVVLMQQILLKYQQQNKGNLFQVVSSLSSKSALVRIATEPIDIAILDIEIDEKTGIDLAKEIQRNHPDCKIIFTTNYDSFAYSAYEIEAFAYLLKPIDERKLMYQLDKIFSIWRKEKLVQKYLRPKLQIKYRGRVLYIIQEDILYIEKCGKNVRIVTEEMTYEYRDNLKDLEERLEKDRFLRCHNGFIVNVNRITSYKRSAIYIGKTELPIPVSKANITRVTTRLEKKLWENIL